MSFTNAQLAQQIADLITYWSSFNEEYSNWLGGEVGGGPGSDGKYPLTNWAGAETLVDCPAQLQDDVDNLVTGAQGYADAAAASAAAASTSESNAATSASTATAQAVLADADRVAAELAESNAASSASTANTQANLASDRAGYAQEWANNAYNVLVSVAAGGNGTDDYSARHWAEHAASLNPGASPSLYARKDAANTFTDVNVFEQDSIGGFIIDRTNATGAAGMGFRNDDGIKGYIGFDDAGQFTVYDAAVAVKAYFTTGGSLYADGNFYPGAQGTNYVSSARIANWQTAYGWGNHGGLYLPADGNFTINIGTIDEPAYKFTGAAVNFGDPAPVRWMRGRASDSVVHEVVSGAWLEYSSGASPAENGYISMYFHSSAPIIRFVNDSQYDITPTKVGQWNTAYGWGDHASAGYAAGSHTHLIADITDANDANWDTAYGWGDHGAQGYLTSAIGAYVQSASAGITLRSTASSAYLELHGDTASYIDFSLDGTGGTDYGARLRYYTDYLAVEAAGFRVSNGPVESDSTSVPTKVSQRSALTGEFLYLDGKEAIDGTDTWLRLNQNGDFTTGVYTPGVLRADGGLFYNSTEQVANTLYNVEGFEKYKVHSASVTAGSWYTVLTDPAALNIAQDPTGKTGASRASAKLKLWDNTSGQHGFVELTVSCNYGRRPAVTIHNSAGYGSAAVPIRAVRVVRYSTYNGVAVQVQAGATGTMYAAAHSQHTGGFTLRDFISETPHATWYVETIDYLDYGSMFPSWGAFTEGVTGADQDMYGIALVDGRFYPAGPAGGYFIPNDEQYGTLQLKGTKGAYAGLALDADGTHVVTFMNSGSTSGIYNDTDNQWHVRCAANGIVDLYYNGTSKLQTASTGVKIAGADDITKTSHGNYLYHQSSSYDNDQNGGITFSTSAASGGTTGDIWFKYT